MSVTQISKHQAALERMAEEDAQECAALVRDKLDDLVQIVSRTVNQFVLRRGEIYSFKTERAKEIYVRALERALNRVLVSKLKG